MWGLATGQKQLRPEAVHVITTTHGRDAAQRALVEERRLDALCKELELNRPALQFHLVRDERGRPLDDIRDTADNTSLANSIMTIVRDMTSSNDIRIHASLSGGRKTMSFYMGYAMSMYGRPCDALYHVMVPGSFESAKDFFYKPSTPEVIVHNGTRLSTADATIELAEIPFLRLRNWLDEPILKAPTVDFGIITKSLQTVLDRPLLSFNDDDCQVNIGEQHIVLRPQLYAMYRLFAEARAGRWPGAGPDGIGQNHFGWLTSDDFAGASSRGMKRFLVLGSELLHTSEAKHSYTKGVIAGASDGSKKGREMILTRFRSIIARMLEGLTEKIVDPAIREQFWIYSEGKNPRRYGLLIDPTAIRLDS
jgi:CRISPR-associated protein (TIGR02584 family)